ncbi:SMR family transporter, partial [Listeria monocytogenes]|uniref:SMR family transporter n=1 Tax=Listeria monocytogenes TaxID=1639 RepID=UPI000E6C304C
IFGWSLLTIAFLIVSFGLFSISMTSFPIGSAYVVFTVIGAAGTAGVAVFFVSVGGASWTIVLLIVLLAGFFGLIFVVGIEFKK